MIPVPETSYDHVTIPALFAAITVMSKDLPTSTLTNDAFGLMVRSPDGITGTGVVAAVTLMDISAEAVFPALSVAVTVTL